MIMIMIMIMILLLLLLIIMMIIVSGGVLGRRVAPMKGGEPHSAWVECSASQE